MSRPPASPGSPLPARAHRSPPHRTAPVDPPGRAGATARLPEATSVRLLATRSCRVTRSRPVRLEESAAQRETLHRTAPQVQAARRMQYLRPTDAIRNTPECLSFLAQLQNT